MKEICEKFYDYLKDNVNTIFYFEDYNEYLDFKNFLKDPGFKEIANLYDLIESHFRTHDLYTIYLDDNACERGYCCFRMSVKPHRVDFGFDGLNYYIKAGFRHIIRWRDYETELLCENQNDISLPEWQSVLEL